MMSVQAHSRLHFGLLNPVARAQPDAFVPSRRFGGVGIMISEPTLRLSVYPSSSWSAEGPAAARALAFARRFAATVPDKVARPQRLVVDSLAPEHAGLGTGTQLGLAVALALAQSWQLQDHDVLSLAERIGRGERSALGIHGFAQGGFLVEAGKRQEMGVSPLIVRADFPMNWRVLLVIPPDREGLHGQTERDAFRRLADAAAETAPTDRLCRLVLLGLLPALHEQDVSVFGEALYEFNRLVGEAFARVQGGIYADAQCEALVRFIRQSGTPGVAQSSWGPTIAAVTADDDRARDLQQRIQERFPDLAEHVLITTGCNRGARFT